MGAYLTDHRPAVQQWYTTRNRPLTGCTVLHTAESVMDTVGPDTGAENVADFIRRRTTPGSYHDLVDSDSWIPLVDLKHGAFHDGTGSNNWALSLSFACATSDWRRMTPEKRRGFLHQGARAFANQQLYRRAIKAPLTRLRLITKAQSDRGESGLTYHGYRDPGRRSDPGVAAPNLFPLDEFIDACRAVLADVMPDHPDAGGRPAVPAPVTTPVPQEVTTMRSVQLTADRPVAVLSVDPVGDSAVLPGVRQGRTDATRARAWLQGAASFFDTADVKALLQWLVCLDPAGKSLRVEKPVEIGHRWQLLGFELPVGTSMVELRVTGIPAGGVVGFHIDGLGHA